MPYDDPGDSTEEDEGALFAFGMYRRWQNQPSPTTDGPMRAGWRFADAIRRKLRI